MARPIKQGLDYFPLDVGFLQDAKVRKIMRACGTQSIPVLISLLGTIYRDDGYYAVWDSDMPFLVADEIGISEGAVTETVAKAVQVEFFSQHMFEKYQILTSAGIQKRYFEAVKRRTEISVVSDFLLISVNDNINLVNACNNSINDNESTQRKEKERKGKESKAEGVGAAASEPVPGKTVFQSYMENINPTPSTSIVDAVNSWIEDGVEEEMMILAIEDAAANNARNWKYIDAILKRCVADGVRTAEQYRARQEQWSRRNKSKHEDAIGNFSQRKYSDDELDGLVYVPGMEAINETNT